MPETPKTRAARHVGLKALPLGAAVAQVRRYRGVSQADLAGRLGLSAMYFSKVESGHRAPSLKMLVQICDALGVEVWRVVRNAQRIREDAR